MVMIKFVLNLQAGNYDDVGVVYSFLDSNKIGVTHSISYIAHANHLESNDKIKTANGMLFYMAL